VPTYQYACTTCGHQLEAVQSFADEPLTECPACEGRLRKLFSSVGVVFKGSGFYRTDSRASGSGNADKSGGSESTKADKADSAVSNGGKTSSPTDRTAASGSSKSSGSKSSGSSASAGKAA
jgi:putative FmdB family regulatory protein